MPSASLLYLNGPHLSFLKNTRTYLSFPYIPNTVWFFDIYAPLFVASWKILILVMPNMLSKSIYYGSMAKKLKS